MSDTASSSEEVQVLRHENAVLRAQLAWFKKRMFGGGKGEKLDAAQLKLDGVEEAREAVTAKTETITYERTKQKKEPRTTPAETFADVPVTEKVEILPEAVKRDPDLYERIGEERTFEIDLVPPKLVKREIIRPKFRHRLDRNRAPVLAPAPARVVPGGYRSAQKYTLLPFRFLRLDPQRFVMTNWAGQHIVVSDSQLPQLIEHRLTDEELLIDLEARHFISRGIPDLHHELLSAQIRTRQSQLPEMAALHMFVLTLRCDHSCGYCQVSRVSEDRAAFDMSAETADRAVDLMLSGPARRLKVEFQGGESLLNFPLLTRIVKRVESRAAVREVAFVVATNLSFLTDEMLDFFKAHRVYISTSLDGPAGLHDHNRPKRGNNSHQRTIEAIRRCREALGHDSVSALMTCSNESLAQPEAIIDEYVNHGFREIFLRELSPYGFAVRSARQAYQIEQFLDFYQRGLSHILNLNRRGVAFREVYASLLLTRMLTSSATRYVDLQSPTGAALGAVVYNYDGDVYASDEGRMLAEMGDRTFRIGNVHRDTWENLFRNSPILDVAYRTMTEGLPQCSECAFQPWCGSDPVRHHATQGDALGHRPTSTFCRKNMEIMRLLVRILEDDRVNARILRKWAV